MSRTTTRESTSHLPTGLIERYQIGLKIRALRLQRNLGLIQLGERAGLSPGMLSKIETGAVFPTLPTLLRIALVFGVGLEYFVRDSNERPTIAVVRKRDRGQLLNGPGENKGANPLESFNFPVGTNKMNAFLAEFSLQSKPSQPHRHDGGELVYILSGELIVNVDGDDFSLKEGDAMYFDSSVAHAYKRDGDTSCSALVVVVP